MGAPRAIFEPAGLIFFPPGYMFDEEDYNKPAKVYCKPVKKKKKSSCNYGNNPKYFDCECGTKHLLYYNRRQHFKTKFHKKYLESKK